MRAISHSCGSRTSRSATRRANRSASVARRDLPLRGRRLGAARCAAELVVVDELRDLARAARRARRVARHAYRVEAHAERVDQQQPPGERVARAEDQLDRLGRLDRADEARQHAEHAPLRAARHEARRGRRREEAAVARPVGRREHRRLPLEAEHRAVDVRLPEQHARVVRQVARGEVVGAVDDEVVAADDLERVRRGEPRRRASRRARAGSRRRAGRAPSRASCGRRRACRAAAAAAGSTRRRRRSRRGRACRRRRRRGRARPAIRARPRRRAARAPP